MVKIADICPLVFNPIRDKFSKYPCYIQRFYASDNILIQIIASIGEPVNGTLNGISSPSTTTITFSNYTINEELVLFYASIKNLSDGIYSVSINNSESEYFEVTSNSLILDESILIRCSHYDNNSPFDNIFFIGETQQFIEYRVEAGFKQSGVSEKIDNEFFRDQFQSLTQLYSVPYETLTLSIGNASGVPYWTGKLINRMLCVSYFEINGIKYVRSEDSIPEPAQVQEDSQLFWFSQLLELNQNDVAGIGGQPQSPDQVGILSVDFNEVRDGEVLRYSSDKTAWINTDTID
jgi:hypothetical protein